MDNELEDKLNTIAYIVIILSECIYIYVTNNKNLTNNEQQKLIYLARLLLFLVALYFIINALIGLKIKKNSSQYKQVIAASLVIIAAFTRLTIKSDDVEFR